MVAVRGEEGGVVAFAWSSRKFFLCCHKTLINNACLRLSSSFFRHSFDRERTGAMRAVIIAAFVSIAAVSATRPGEDIVVRPGPDTVHFGGYER